LGQKVNPISFRIGITRSWLSLWYAKKDYAKLLHEDLGIRKFLKKKLYHAGVSKIEIERAAQKISINVFSARPGIIIGKRGYEIDRLKANLQKRVASKQLSLNIKEVRKTEINAQLVAENIALQLERRVAFRRAMKKSVTTALRFGAKGIRINCAGRLGGAEIARTEWYRQGRVPLHTLRADIDYGFAESRTTYGIIGVKAWIFHGEIIPEKKEPAANKLEANPES
jgi:small subunit ribosomal protein S3